VSLGWPEPISIKAVTAAILIQALLDSEQAPEFSLTACSSQRDAGRARDASLENVDSQSTAQRELKSTGQLHGVKLVRSNTRLSDQVTLFTPR